jgi:signal transduction histidine kinase
MRKVLENNLGIGFLFGVIFALIAFLTNMDITWWILLALPFAIAVLCAAGGFVATLVIDRLEKHSHLSSRAQYVVGFLAAALFNLVIVVGILYRMGQFTVDRQSWLGGLIGLSMGAIYAAYRFTIDRVNERVAFLAELADKNRQLQEASRLLAITEERNRMSRELHDSISQGLHGLTFSLHTLRRECADENARVAEILDHMEATADATLKELRSMIDELKPSLLAEQGLDNALRMICDLFSQRSAVPLELDYGLQHPLAPEAELAIFRIVQEGLANIERHASAQHVTLRILEREADVLLTLADDGRGFATDRAAGNGLHNMCRRAEEVNGSFKVTSKVGVGTTVSVTLPKATAG